jgi:hypothetical protein
MDGWTLGDSVLKKGGSKRGWSGICVMMWYAADVFPLVFGCIGIKRQKEPPPSSSSEQRPRTRARFFAFSYSGPGCLSCLRLPGCISCVLLRATCTVQCGTTRAAAGEKFFWLSVVGEPVWKVYYYYQLQRWRLRPNGRHASKNQLSSHRVAFSRWRFRILEIENSDIPSLGRRHGTIAFQSQPEKVRHTHESTQWFAEARQTNGNTVRHNTQYSTLLYSPVLLQYYHAIIMFTLWW